MLTADERTQIQNFEEAVSEVIDEYLKEGMDPDQIRDVLRGHIASDLHGRRSDMQEAAWERHCETLMEGGGGPSLQEQQQAAYKIKHGLR